MRTKQGKSLESLRAVQLFLSSNATSLAAVVVTGARQRLDDAIAVLDAHAGTQTGGALSAQCATRDYHATRQALLRDHMTPIAKIAKSELPLTPELEPLRLPRGYSTPERLRAAAVGMANAAAPYESVFLAAGLPPDFIAQLDAAASATTDALGARKQNRANAAGATKGLAVTLSAARKLVDVLDSFVKTAAKNDPALLASWASAKRVGRVSGPHGSTSNSNATAAAFPIPALVRTTPAAAAVVPPTQRAQVPLPAAA